MKNLLIVLLILAMTDIERAELLEAGERYVEEHRDDWRPYTVTPKCEENWMEPIECKEEDDD